MKIEAAEILRISIEMGHGQPDQTIVLRENESPQEVAMRFANKFRLGPNAALALEN